MNRVYFITGVSGAGKSTIANMLSFELGIPYFDGDDFHPQDNVQKMSNGIPLNDRDRYSWLLRLNQLAKENLKDYSCIIASSALKQSYRDILSKDIENRTQWIHLSGTFDQIEKRIKNRKDHFMSSDLLKSQFDILENPNNALILDVSLTTQEIIKMIKEEVIDKAQLGVFGLGVMGKNLSRNLARNGFKISLYNRHIDGKEEHVAVNFVKEFAELSSAVPFDDLEDFINSLQRPRKIILMVRAGKTTDNVIDSLMPFLSASDIIIDGGNSNYLKTKARMDQLRTKNINLIGTGISGGEEGALKGPSLMPGGNKEIYNLVQHFLESIAAKDKDNVPCCTYIGREGSGHFVKMVHNGIEYAEMQLLAEVFTILSALRKTPDEIADILESWKATASSYLLDVTIKILRKKEGNDWLVNKILDKAGNKGTGNWATIASAELGVPSTLVATALFARYISFYKEDRIEEQKTFRNKTELNVEISLNELLKAYQFARIINHYQGFQLIGEASKFYKWDLNLSEIARIWTAGCIIKSDLMIELAEFLGASHTILKNKKIIQQIKALKHSANRIVSHCITEEIPIPCLSDSINFFNGLTTANSSANLIQAQRDYFGAHTYQRLDDLTGEMHHTNWRLDN
jgi:6-phosphogluconate dehydrogenase